MIFWFLRIVFFPPPAAQRAARTFVPSMHQSSLSISPASTYIARSRERISSSVPSAFHLLNKSHTVLQGPNSSGKSRHGDPVLIIHRIPSIIIRRSEGGRPVLAGAGKMPEIQSHCSSASRCLAIFYLLVLVTRHHYPLILKTRKYEFSDKA